MDCPYCHTTNVTVNKCPVCKAIIPMPKKVEEVAKETGKTKFNKRRK